MWGKPQNPTLANTQLCCNTIEVEAMSGVEENNGYKDEEIPSSNVASVNDIQETELDPFEKFNSVSRLTDDLPTVSSRVECHPKVYLPIICLAFKVKYNLSKACLQDHLRILSLTTECSIEEIKSAAKCFKKYEHLKENVKKVFVCTNRKCDAVLTSMGKNGFPTKNFQPCGHPYNKLLGSCYILILPVEEQLKYFLENGGADRWNKVSTFDGSTRGDLQSGSCYMENVHRESEFERVITLQLNVDGAQCFKSSKFNFWPFMAVINESPYWSRRSNMILMSLWYGNKKPPRDPFLEAALNEIERLGNSGIYYGGFRYFVKPVVLTTDTMARTVFLNCIQFNGESGFDFCLHPGRQIKKGKGTSRIYPEPIDGFTSFALRTLEQHNTDLDIVLRCGKIVNGIKGPSPLTAISNFDYIKAQVPDYLHCVCQGVIKMLIGLWTNTSHSNEPWYLDNSKRVLLNERILEVKPPYEVTRTSRSIEEIALWKASELRAFALYYFSVLEGLLPEEFYRHFLYLLYGLQVLLQENVSLERVKETEIVFRHFVLQAAVLYGEKHIRFNMHLLTHLSQSVINWGCLWTTSTFIPEWFNGQLVALINGTQSAAEQMVHSFRLRNVIRAEAIEILSRYHLPYNVATLLRDLLHIPVHMDEEEEGYFHVTSCGIKLLGRPKQYKTSLDYDIALSNYIKNTPLDFKCMESHHTYNRLLIPRIQGIFSTVNYMRSPKRLNDCAFMNDGKFFIVESILYFNSLDLHNQPFVIGRSMGTISSVTCSPPPVSGIVFNKFPGQSTWLIGLSKFLVVYSAKDIVKKCVLVLKPSVHIHSYIVTALPNSVESD